MLRTMTMIMIVAALGFGAAQARADHNKELGYLIGGAIVGAAIGELAYQSRYPTVAAPYYASPQVYVRYDSYYRPPGYRAYRAYPYRPARYCDLPRHRRFGRHGHH
jgi:hypothetical protein